MEQLVARRAHNPKVVGSSPAPATTQKPSRKLEGFFRLSESGFTGFEDFLDSFSYPAYSVNPDSDYLSCKSSNPTNPDSEKVLTFVNLFL